MTAAIEQAALPENVFQDAAAAAAEWALVASAMAGEVFPGRMRVVDSAGNYPWKRRKPLSQTPPPRPAAVELFDTSTGTARVLAIDIDATVVGARVAAEHAAAVAQIVRTSGMHPWIDASESGGRHVIARLPHPVGREALAAVVRALHKDYPSVDTAPVSGLQGCLRPTGSRHKQGGWQRHVGSIDQLRAAVTTPPATDSWRRLCAQVPPVEQPAADEPVQRTLPGTRLTGEAIGEILHRQAVNGPTKAIHTADQSRFRYRVERAAVEAGFTEDEYVDAVVTQWAWMHASYARKGRVEKVAADHYGYARRKPRKKREVERRRKSYSQILDTSHPNNPRPPPAPADLTARKWLTHARRVARAHDLTAHQRWLVTVLAGFALSKHSLKLDAGLRAYALGCGMSHELVRHGLQLLADLGLIRRVGERKPLSREADVWELVVDQVHNESPAPGWIQGLRHAFIELGPMAGEIYELLVVHGNPAKGRKRRKRPTGKGIAKTAAMTSTEIALLTGYSPSAVKEALGALAAWDLAVYVPRRKDRPGGWIGGKADPNKVAALLGADEVFEYRRAGYARQRARWWAWLSGFRKHRAQSEPTLSLFDLEVAAGEPPDDSWLSEFVDIPPWARDDPSAAG